MSFNIQRPVAPNRTGYEFTGGFSDAGSIVNYTQGMVDADQWLRFGFSAASNVANDVAYWTDPDPALDPTFDQTKGLFGGLFMPEGVSELIDFDFNESPGYNAGVTGQSLNYTAATGSFDFSECKQGDYLNVRFDFNCIPQVANTTLEVALIWQTRDDLGNPTFTFPLTGTPIFFGTGTATVGQQSLNRPMLSAYFASNEDVRAKALLAVKANNPIQIEPITTLATIIR